LHYYSAEIHLYEACFKMSSTTQADYSMESLRPADLVYNCFVATRSFFDLFLSLPTSDYFTLSIVNIGHMFHALGALYKLSVFDFAEWDKNEVRTTLNLSSILNQISICGEEAFRLFGGRIEANNPWLYCSRKYDPFLIYIISRSTSADTEICRLRTLQSWWDAKLLQEAEAVGLDQDDSFVEFEAMTNLDFWDDNFWK